MTGQAYLFPESTPVQDILIVASCTQGKRYPVPADLRLGTVTKGSLPERLVEWGKRLEQSEVKRVPAEDLYRGQHWAVVRNLPALAQAAGYRAKLWVASAGYGLVAATEQVRPYSATFAGSGEDSVWKPSDGDRRRVLGAWWNGLQALPGRSRSLTGLAEAEPTAVILVIASPAYVLAMADDLAGARARLLDPKHLIVISSRASSFPDWLKEHLVPSEAPLSGVLGGARGSLHARTARRILEEAGSIQLDAGTLVKHYSRLVSESGEATVYKRLKLTDDEVRKFIRKAIVEDEKVSCTSALRKLRETGQACEQRRFSGLYQEVRGRSNVA